MSKLHINVVHTSSERDNISQSAHYRTNSSKTPAVVLLSEPSSPSPVPKPVMEFPKWKHRCHFEADRNPLAGGVINDGGQRG